MDGVIIDNNLEYLIIKEKPKFFYIIPTFNNPTSMLLYI